MDHARQLAALQLPLILESSAPPDIILDSGAYSVWRSGANVDLDRYHEYCSKVKDITLTCVNLDVIPGKWGQRATPTQVEEACEESYDRWQHFEKTGAMIMPVFHQTDELHWLDRYLQEGAIYIGISPTDSFSAATRYRWLHDVHEYIATHSGRTLNKDVFTHCLGVFAPSFLYDLPAWSADASTLLRYVAMKRILLPKFDSGQRKIISWEAVATGPRAPMNEPIDWNRVKRHLDELLTPYTMRGERVLLDDPSDMIHVNLDIAKTIMKHTGVRCFVAGNYPMVIYAVTVHERYPYILRSYAIIKERTGDTVKHVYLRTHPKPQRKPEKDRKVVPARGLFT